MSKLVKVINNLDRYFNWARKWQIIEVSEDRVDYYLQHGFSKVEEIVEKNNIVTQTTPEGIDNNLTVAQLKKELDHLWVDYTACKNKIDFQNLLVEARKNVANTPTSNDWKTIDIEAIKKQLVDEAIVEATELEGKTDDEIKQIATDNWLI